MAEITYGGFTFTTSSSGTLLINGGGIDGPLALTYVDEISPASFTGIASSPRVPESAKAAVIALGNSYQDISAQMQAANKAEYDAAHPPTPPQDTAATQITNNPTTQPADSTTPAAAPAGTNSVAGAALSGTEQNNLSNQVTNSDSAIPVAVSQANEVMHSTDPIPSILVSSNSTAKNAITADTNPDASINTKGPIVNPLHAYPSWTYGLSLHMLTITEYNNIVKNQNYVPNRVIIASAGRYNNTPGPSQFIRAPHFDVDFYFENLNMQTVIGLNEHSRATNAVNFSFSIIEPYGITLFNRILKLTKEINPESENYLEQPYLLQIDFFASNDAGEIVGIVPNQTKRIPIRILKADIKVSNKGAEYSFQAAPYAHSAFDTATVSTPAHFEVVAGTVGSFFQSNEAEIAAIQAQASNQRETQQTTGIRQNTSTYNGLSGGVIGPDGQITYVNSALLSSATQAAIAANQTGDPIYSVKSYGSALNAWQKELKDTKKIKVEDHYYFKFDPVIGNANFDLNGKLGAKDLPMVDRANTKAHRQGNTGVEIQALDYKTKIFSINTGTSVEQVLNYVIRNSSYVLGQMTVPEDYGADPQGYISKKKTNSTLPLKWYKIIPTVELGEFDSARKVWARNITYNVVPYDVYNTKISVAPQGTWDDPVKEYNYIYTGKNVDVLDFDIEFNAMYYTAVTAYRNNLASITGMPVDEENKADNPASYDGIDDAANAIQPIREKPQTLDARARATGGSDTPTAAAAVDVEQSLYTTAGGDMLQAKLKITGDPMFIKQDDIFYPPEIAFADSSNSPYNTGIDTRLIASGSLHMDRREVYIRVNYRSPSDIDENTGLMKFDSNYLTSLFSGMYKILTVNSTFSGGQFIQSLDTVRLPRQKMPGDTSGQPSQRVDTPPVVNKQAPETSTTQVLNTAVDSTAPNNKPIVDTPPVGPDLNQKQLATVAADAPTTNITAENQPVSTPVSVPPPAPLPAGVTQDPVTGNYIYKGVTFGGDLQAGIQAIDTNSTVTYNAVDPVSGTVMTHTVDGAALNAAYSQSGQLQSAAQTAQESVAHVQAVLASDPTAYGTVAQGQQVLAMRQARADAAVAAYNASLK